MRSTSPGPQKNQLTISPTNLSKMPKQMTRSPKMSTKSLSLSKSGSKPLSKPSPN
jgi:hypothetical protein